MMTPPIVGTAAGIFRYHFDFIQAEYMLFLHCLVFHLLYSRQLISYKINQKIYAKLNIYDERLIHNI